MSKTPGKMISPKDRLYIMDLLGNSILYAKKSKAFLQLATDEDVKLQLNEFYDLLTSNVDELLQLVEEEQS